MQKIFQNGLFIICFVVLTATTLHAQSGKKYIDTYKELVASLSAEYGIPASIITAVSIIESGAGKSRNCRLLNNHFGVKGKNNLLKTKGIKSRYKQYTTNEESFIDFCKIISRKKYYPKLKGNNDYTLWINAIAKAGYSTTPEVWKKEINKAVRYYKLYKIDEASNTVTDKNTTE
ncbi:MAG: glucosaminidase domain-containing protein [Chitinophagaceae bacterium]|nr:glucosaminidase domain-containing protein [Chitinophagaceae bacterium]MCW5904743.1 glucosaminidase domain-containing protein [Chitinophagaceae bacterium]